MERVAQIRDENVVLVDHFYKWDNGKNIRHILETLEYDADETKNYVFKQIS